MRTYRELQTVAEAWADKAATSANRTSLPSVVSRERMKVEAAIALAYAQLAANALADSVKPVSRSLSPGRGPL